MTSKSCQFSPALHPWRCHETSAESGEHCCGKVPVLLCIKPAKQEPCEARTEIRTPTEHLACGVAGCRVLRYHSTSLLQALCDSVKLCTISRNT